MMSLEISSTDEIKRHPEVETLLVTRDNRNEVMKKVLNWLTAGVD
jgi:nucleoside-triphosphatase THEP1